MTSDGTQIQILANWPMSHDPAFTGSIFVCGPLHHHILLSKSYAAGLFEFTIIVNLEHCFPGYFRKEQIEKKIVLSGLDFNLFFSEIA